MAELPGVMGTQAGFRMQWAGGGWSEREVT